MTKNTPALGLWILSCFALLACGSDEPRSALVAGSGGSSDAGAHAGEHTGTASKFSASIRMPAVQPAAEDHVCVVVDLGNADPVWVNDVHAMLSTGSHHLIVDRRPADTALQSQPESCEPTMAGDATRLMIAQQPDTHITLPAHVAYRLEAHQRLFLQLHYINLADHAEDITGGVELTLAPSGDTTPSQVYSVFTGATEFELPPREPTTVHSFVQPGQATHGVRHVFALTSHTHSLGVRSSIERVPSTDAPDSTPIHESLDWSEPPLTAFAPPLVLSADEGLRLTCEFMNTTDHVVTFGTSFHDEMCFMWLYYYDL